MSVVIHGIFSGLLLPILGVEPFTKPWWAAAIIGVTALTVGRWSKEHDE